MAPGSDSTDQLIDPNDFRSFDLRISFENETTHTAVKDGKRIYGEKKASKTEDLSVQLIQFQADDLVIEVPEHSCAEGHKLIIHVEAGNLPPTKMNPTGKLKLTAKTVVAELEKLDGHRDRVRLEFAEYSEWDWKNLFDVYAERQRQILEFFNALKGIEG